MKPLCSIIIRTKNEERWITPCLKAVFQQKNVNYEVVIVDNESTDNTIYKAQQFNIRNIVYCEKYTPGKALNMGIKNAKGHYIACLSGHCIPVNENWLYNLLMNFDDTKIAGVYGRQEPLAFTPDSDKRDLMLVFGLDKRIQIKDSFFHNANSMIRKELWEKIPFDEKVTNIEDRVWAQKVQSLGYKIVYEPEASVYHYHGIHQDGDPERCENVVKILKNFDTNRFEGKIDLKDLNIVAIIPFKRPVLTLGGKPIVAYTVEKALSSSYVKKVIISSDTEEIYELMKNYDVLMPFIRPSHLSDEFINMQTVLKYTINEIYKIGLFPDIVVVLSPTFPFLPDTLIDDMINYHIYTGFDSTIPVRIENRSLWEEYENGIIRRIERVYENAPRGFQEKRFISYEGLCCITHSEYLINEQLLHNKIGFYEINDFYHCIEIRNDTDIFVSEYILDYFKERKQQS